MTNRLSYSAATKYTTCGEMYRLHYIERLRPNDTGSALVFGNAFDQALNAMLEGRDDWAKVFVETFETIEINKEKIKVLGSDKIKFSKASLDKDLLTESDYATAATYPEHLRHNVLAYLSLMTKGLIMLRDYEANVLPHIEVIAIQEKVELTNSNGDKFIGITDLIARYQGEVVIFDNKTYTPPYVNDNVAGSEQLAIYMHALGDKYGTRKAGYINISKNLQKNRTKDCSVCGHSGTGTSFKTCNNEINGKRCGGKWNETINPTTPIKIYVDEIPEENEDAIIENMDIVNQNISQGYFPKNEKICNKYFGGKCPYYDLCHKGSRENLVDLNKENK